eukprot:10604031-Heterocapsa_arctica.AAC.1
MIQGQRDVMLFEYCYSPTSLLTASWSNVVFPNRRDERAEVRASAAAPKRPRRGRRHRRWRRRRRRRRRPPSILVREAVSRARQECRPASAPARAHSARQHLPRGGA